jgi:radical SAM superfamily enzyme
MVDERFLEVAGQLRTKLEFGLQTIHDHEGSAIHRKNQIARVAQVLGEVRRRGIEHEVTLIFGLPGQSLASFQESVRWCLERRIPVIRAFPLMLLRGTELEQQRDRWNLVDDGSPMAKVIASNTFTTEEWLQMARLAEALGRTEGDHPTTLEPLLDLASKIEPSLARWQPSSQEAAE